MATTEVDVSEIAEALRTLFTRWAVPHPEIRARHNVEVRAGTKAHNHDKLLVRFMTKDNLRVEFEVEGAELLRDHERYMTGLVEDLQRSLDAARQRRQDMTRMVVRSERVH